MMPSQILVKSEEAGHRLDVLLAMRLGETRSHFQKIIEDGRVLLNGRQAKKRECPKEGDQIEVAFLPSAPTTVIPEQIPLDILYEDEVLLLVNKPAGMVVHPAPGHAQGTLANALLAHCGELDASDLRPGVVHRLDKETSGVILAAKNEKMQHQLMRLFAERRVQKEYVAICVGNPGRQTIDRPIGRLPRDRKKMGIVLGGREAETEVESLFHHEQLSFVRLFPKTGRTHQLRVHLQSVRTPIVGDPLYGSAPLNKKWKAPRLLLHAAAIAFTHPISGEEIAVRAPLPADMIAFARRHTLPIEGQ